MSDEEVTESQIIEALLFSSPQPLSIADLKKSCGLSRATQVRQIIAELNLFYAEHARPYRAESIAGGYQLRTEKRFRPWLLRVESIKPLRLSASAMEILAIIAYKQPITRVEVEGIRAVDSGYGLRALLKKNLITISGRAELPGRPLLYRTSPFFLQVFGFENLAALPRPEEISLPDENSSLDESDLGDEPAGSERSEGVQQIKPSSS